MTNNTLETWFNTTSGSVNSSSAIPSRKGVFCARWNGTQYTAYHNGTQYINVNAGSTPAGNIGGNLGFGSYTSDPSPVWAADAYVGNIIVYNTALTDTQRIDICNWLKSKWSV